MFCRKETLHIYCFSLTLSVDLLMFVLLNNVGILNVKGCEDWKKKEIGDGKKKKWGKESG